MPESQDKNNKPNDILIVDAEIPDLRLLSEMLSREGYQVRSANNPQLAIDSALAQPPKLILMDVRMPEMDGFQVCKRLKQDERARDVPIIFISALHQIEDKIQGFEAGGADFISKPFQKDEVLARVRTHLELRNMQLQLEELVTRRIADVVESEERFRVTFEQAAVGIAHVSIEGRFLRLNRKFCDIVGYTQDELLDLSFQDITHPDDLDADLTFIQQVTNGGTKNYTTEKRYYHKDGSIVWISLNASMLFGRKGTLRYFVSVIQDISDRKKAEEALRASRDFLEHLTSAVPDAIFSVKTPERTINWANDSFNVIGYEPEEYIGKKTFSFYANPKDYDAVGKLQQHAIRKGKDMIRTEIMVRRKDGRAMPAELTATYYREAGKLSQITAMIRDISDRKQAEAQIKKLQNQLQAESAYLQEEIKLEHNFEHIIGQSDALNYVLHRVEMVAPQVSTVLILGETGTGKELIARALHRLGSRNKRPLVKVNCAALPGELIESELFGREKGAFTGAATSQIGRFELANNSTLFLDEIGELPLDLQAKLLRVLESGEFERLGNSRTLHSNARIIAATNRDLEAEVRKMRFREDLWYRLKVFPITIPPLRDRIQDIPLLIDHFAQLFSRRMGKGAAALKITKGSMRALKSYSWPGNVRELKHVVESALISLKGKILRFDLPKTSNAGSARFKPIDEMERDYILEVLKATKWKIGGKDSASSILALPPSTLRSRMKKNGLKRP
jgi:PAS domain S-box-containing protein